MEGGRFHTYAFAQAVGAVAQTNTAINGVADGQFTLSTTTTFISPEKGSLVAAFSIGQNMTRTRLNIPSLRMVGLPSLTPINTGTTVPSPVNICRVEEGKIIIPPVEPISFEVTSPGAVGENPIGVFFSVFKFQPTPPGTVFRVRGTTTIAGVINTWQNGGITLDQPLQQGRYAIVGLDVVAANVIAARLVFAVGGYRPGCLARNGVASIMHPYFTDGRLGVYGEFTNSNVPNLEILLGAGGASASQEVFLDLVRLGNAV